MSGLSDLIPFMLSPESLVLLALGTSLGIVVGAIPGLTGAMLIALSLPLTFSMDGDHALVLLISMYVGSVSGGLITATLLRMPGTPASLMTTLDGYPLAKRGRPGRALGLGIGASLTGGLFSWCVLVLLARPMAVWSTKLGDFDFFSLVLMALVLIASVGGKSLVRGLFSGMLGILAAMPGASPATGEIRWTFGFHELDDGFKLLPVLIGLFAVSQIVHELLTLHEPAHSVDAGRSTLDWRWSDWMRHKFNLLRSSVLGTVIGILPGIGANIGSVVAYTAARNSSRTPNEFGTGSEEGIVASEAANNATVGGALIPLIALGIPGSVIDAILLGALVIHGLQPGPLLFENNPQTVNVIMATMLLANLCMFAFLWLFARRMARLAALPRHILLPVILTFCIVGSYALANRMFDVWVMLGFGLIGVLMDRTNIPTAPFVIGFVLAPIAEEKFAAGLMESGGSYLPLFTRPFSLTFCLLSVILFGWSVRQHLRSAKEESVLLADNPPE
jgi:putative tricarboxylic transport membrane protein